MDNIVIVTDSESDSDYSNDSDTHDQREEVVYENTHFMNHEKVEDYEKGRNKLFTPEISRIRILIDSKNITHKTTDHDTSNYTVELNGDDTSNSTAGFGKYENVIGFKLIKAIILNTVYQVTTNNNTINFNYDGSNKVSTLTPGKY